MNYSTQEKLGILNHKNNCKFSWNFDSSTIVKTYRIMPPEFAFCYSSDICPGNSEFSSIESNFPLEKNIK